MSKIYYLLVATVFLFSACGKPTTAFNYFKQDDISANAIQHTKKRDLIVENEIEAMIFVSYLNKIHPKYNLEKKDSFLVGLHLINSKKNDLRDKNTYSFLLNDADSITIIEVPENSELVEKIPLKNRWAKYYIVSFKSIKKERKLNLSFSHVDFGETLLSFQR